MESDNSKFLDRETDKPDIDNDFIRGRRLTDQESLALMFQDTIFNEEEFKRVFDKYVKCIIWLQFLEQNLCILYIIVI